MDRSTKHLIEAGLFITTISIVSKALGIVREVALAYFFGTSKVVDAFRIAQSAVFLPLHVFAGSTLNDSLIPTIKSLMARRRERLLWVLVNQVAVLLIAFGIVLVIAQQLFTAQWLNLLAPGFDRERLDIAIILTRWISLVIPFYVLSSMLIIVLNSFYSFKGPSLRPLMQNVFLIFGIFLTKRQGIYDPLGIAFPAGILAFCLIVLPQAWKRHRFTWSNKISRAGKVWSYFLSAFSPLFVFVLIQRANLIVDRVISSYLEVGSVAALDYARFVIETPMTTVGLGLVQVALPFLSDLHAEGKSERSIRDIGIVTSYSLVVMITLSAFVWLEAGDIVKLLYGYGSFGAASVDTTTSALRGFSFGLWALFAAFFLQRVYNAQRRNGALLASAACSLLVNAVLNVVLSRMIGVQGIAVATSVASVLYFALLVGALNRGFAAKTARLCAVVLPGALVVAALLNPFRAAPLLPAIRLVLMLIAVSAGLIGWLLAFPVSRTVLVPLVRDLRRRITK